jgi:hypothetical protein
MEYLALIRQAAATFEGGFSLAELLARVDALNRSVPTLTELNDAFARIHQSGDLGSHDWLPASPEAYAQALASNREAMARFCEGHGISQDQQASILKWHASLWRKHVA